MAIIKCGECGNEVSDKASACPKCGAKVEKHVGPIGKIIALIFLAFFIKSILSSQEAQEQAAMAESKKSPEQVAAEKKNKAEQELRFNKVVIVGTALKKQLNDPASLEFETIMTDDTAKTICMIYRAKNGFGALIKEMIVIYDGIPSQEPHDWNKHCADRQLHDLRYARLVIN